MDNIIINNLLINKEQITKIEYKMEYNKISGILYTISPFLCYYKDDEGYNHKRYIRSNSVWHEEYIEGEEVNKMYNEIQKFQAQTNFIESSGSVYAWIELSSGAEIKTNIFKFKNERWFDRFRTHESVFPITEKREGIEFKSEDINIEYISDLIFKNKKHKVTKREI